MTTTQQQQNSAAGAAFPSLATLPDRKAYLQRHELFTEPVVCNDPSCSDVHGTAAEVRLVSQQQAEHATIVFANHSGHPVRLLWVDWTGQEVAYGRLEPGQQARYSTFTKHVWVARDIASGRRLCINGALAVVGAPSEQLGRITAPPAVPYGEDYFYLRPDSVRRGVQAWLLACQRASSSAPISPASPISGPAAPISSSPISSSPISAAAAAAAFTPSAAAARAACGGDGASGGLLWPTRTPAPSPCSSSGRGSDAIGSGTGGTSSAFSRGGGSPNAARGAASRLVSASSFALSGLLRVYGGGVTKAHGWQQQRSRTPGSSGGGGGIGGMDGAAAAAAAADVAVAAAAAMAAAAAAAAAADAAVAAERARARALMAALPRELVREIAVLAGRPDDPAAIWQAVEPCPGWDGGNAALYCADVIPTRVYCGETFRALRGASAAPKAEE